MPIIKPISDLRNHADRISDICHKEAEPVFITKNGEGDMVVMSQALYEQIQARLDLYRMLDEADRDERAGMKDIPHEQVMRELKKIVQ